MSRKIECLRKIEWTVEHCDMSKEAADKCKKALGFMEEHPEFSDFSTDALQPLLVEIDPEIRGTVIKSVENMIKRHPGEIGKDKVKENFGSKRKMRGVIAGLYDGKNLKEAKKQRYYSKAEISEHVASFVNWMYDAGVEEKVIVELVVKAVVLERR